MSYFDTGKPLTAASDNMHMTALAEIARIVAHPSMPGIGDAIDQGLITLRLLNEAGYDVVPRKGAPLRNHPQTADYLPTRERYIEIIAASNVPALSTSQPGTGR